MKKIIIASITAVVVITVLAGCLMPVLDDATTTQKTFTNEGLWRMKAIEEGDVWTYDGTNWYLDSELLTDVTKESSNGLLGGAWCVRTNGQARGTTIAGNASTVTATASEITIEISGSGLTTTTQALPGYGASNDGAFIMTSGTGTDYVNGDSILYGTGQTSVDNIGVVIHVEGNVDDGVTFTMYQNKGGAAISNAVFSNVQVNATPVSGYDDLYSFESLTADVTFDATVNDTTASHTGSVTYNRIVIPYEVTAEKSVHFTDGENAIFNAIPAIVIVALLLAVVALVLRSRMN